MTIEEFKDTLPLNEPPDGLSAHLLALWYDAKGDWNRSHDIIQDLSDKNASRIHAYLHRKEGDIGNADYWYFKANKKRLDETLDEEWERIVRACLL